MPSPRAPEPEKPAEALKPPEPMGPPPPPQTWTASEVEAGRKDCERRLSGLHILFGRPDPIREGACGLPSPIRLNGFESQSAPHLQFDPAPTTSCRMAQALRRWFDEVVQPQAKAYLHATIVRMSTLSGYDCRSRYDDPAQRLSQHAYGNALDVAEFVTARGERIAVADAWSAGDERAAFLHDIHDGACRIFGTDAALVRFHARAGACSRGSGRSRCRASQRRESAGQRRRDINRGETGALSRRGSKSERRAHASPSPQAHPLNHTNLHGERAPIRAKCVKGDHESGGFICTIF